MGELYEIFDDGDDPISRFEVRDLRVKTRFAIDNVFYDEFLPLFGPTLSAVYIALVRHANKEQKTWPSQARIAAQIGISRQWVSTQLQILELFNLIRKVRIGKMCTNRYYLIDEKHWRRDFEHMRDRLAVVLEVIEKGKNSKGEKMMSTEFTSLMGTPVNVRVVRSTHQMLLEFTSNRKDNQSKDTQKKRGKISVKKATKKTEAPKEIHVGKGDKVDATFDPAQNAIIYRHYS
jgi:Helix-turn-helix domain